MAKIKLLFLLFCAISLHAQELLLKMGESRVFSTSENITTVFTSDPKVLDYNIIDTNKVIIFAVKDGYASISAFGGDNSKVLLNVNVTIDPLAGELDKIAKMIESKNPGTTLKIDRLAEPGKRGYVLTGEVPDEGTRDHVYNMAAVALGLSIQKEGGNFQGTQGANAEGGEGAQDVSSSQNKVEFLEKVKTDNLIDKLTLPPFNQVKVKLIIADVDKELIEQLGIDFNKGVYTFPNLNSGMNFGSYFNGVSIIPVIKALKNDKAAKIIAQPNLSVMSGEEATFEIQNEYTTFQEAPNNSGLIGGSPAIVRGPTIRPGLTLKIAPKISNKNKIKLKISQNMSNIYRYDEKGQTTIADLRKRSTENVIELADGDSFILAGLIDEKEIETVTSVPFLGDIPFIGGLFRSTNITRSKSELVIMATVELVQPIKDGARYQIPTFKARSLGESLINVDFVRDRDINIEVENFISNTGFVR